MWCRTYFTYLLTNADRTVLYTGVTNDLRRRLIEHWIGKEGSFTTRYQVHYLVWHEESRYVLNAIALEKEIKAWPRQKKDRLIVEANPDWRFLNASIVDYWPPLAEDVAAVQAYLKKYPDNDPWL